MADVASAVTALQKVVAQSQSPSRFNTEIVRIAWNQVQRRRREARDARRRAARDLGDEYSSAEADLMCYSYIEQLWTDHIIIRMEDATSKYMRIPYTVASPGTDPSHVKFGAPEVVQQAYVAASAQRRSEALEMVALRQVAGSERESLKAKGKTLPGTTSYPIKSLSDLSNAIQAYGRAKPEDRDRLKAHLLRHAKRLGASQAVIDRINNLGKSDSVKTTADLDEGLVALARVRTQAGSRRYKKSIGAPINNAPDSQSSGVGNLKGAGVTPDKLRGAVASSKQKSFKSRLGTIGDEKSLKSALSKFGSLSGDQQGAAAAEVVKAAQALGLTSMVPASVKRLYRQYIAQSTISVPSKAPTVSHKK